MTDFSAESFFSSHPPPEGLDETLESLEEFIAFHVQAQRKVVLVTSGGTTVPLEHNVVRFLDNFSAGTRGASSAEHFLRTGQYAVIFMHRQHSLQPFSRHYSHSTHPFLDLIDIEEPSSTSRSQSQPSLAAPKGPNGYIFPLLTGVQSPSRPSTPQPGSEFTFNQQKANITLSEPNLTPMLSLLKSYKLVRSQNLLHTMTFTTVQEYLFLLRGVSKLMAKHLGRRGMFYMAAAVSDFFIPQQRMNEHKIQSGKGSLVIEMDQVPKILKPLVEKWSQEAFIVSFKLETDDDLLIPKARGALDRYGHQLVIGNTLKKRKQEVVFVEMAAPNQYSEEWLRLSIAQTQDGSEMEELIVDRLVDKHEAWIRQ